MSRRDDGRFGFTVIEIDADLETIPDREDAVRHAAAEAERSCLVSHAVDVPVHIAITIKTVAEQEQTALA